MSATGPIEPGSLDAESVANRARIARRVFRTRDGQQHAERYVSRLAGYAEAEAARNPQFARELPGALSRAAQRERQDNADRAERARRNRSRS